MKKVFLGIMTIMFCGYVSAQEWLTDIEIAKSKAADQNKPIVMVFQGSDWCAPCIKLDKNIWSKEAFKKHATEEYVMLKVDFPRRRKNKLSKEVMEKNNMLAAQYNPNGAFPLVVIINSDGEVLGKMGYEDISVDAYMAKIDGIIKPHYTQVDEQTGSHMSNIYKEAMMLMGCDFEITVVAGSQDEANIYIKDAVSEISRIEQLISSWSPDSQTSKINRNAGVKPVHVDPELISLIERASAISRLTDGAFDISYASMDKIWQFDGSMQEMPNADALRASIDKVGYQNIIIDTAAHTVYLPKKGMKIGFGAIGKGYAADKAKELLVARGVTSGIINASGDMNAWGKQPDGSDWKVAITNPMDKSKSYAILPIEDAAVVTSGNYEKYVLLDGKRYSHIIDPRTGMPSTGLVSVTVFAPSAELADALATSIFVMGAEAGIDRINQMPNIECIAVDDQGNIISSANIEIDRS